MKEEEKKNDIPTRLPDAMNKKITIIAKDAIIRRLSKALGADGYSITPYSDIAAAMSSGSIGNIIFFDLSLAARNAGEVVRLLKDAHPVSSIIVITKKGGFDDAVETVQAGASDYLEKPIRIIEARIKIERAMSEMNLRRQLADIGNGDAVAASNGHSVADFLESKLDALLNKMARVENINLYDTVMAEVEKALFRIVLKKTNGNQLNAARILGVNRNTLNKKMRGYKALKKNK
ncbi:MAG: response regulator [Nitrospirae bacterium]|nr:response regulator [Nitrospirota bacterium]